ncbi:hypothetical protein [Psychroserpens algicola]|uniref:Fibronectin type-III domain-containing protein n=1 Tax=Psychroserpens algicola TaxID=1719034 RepID=A0ABT0H3Q3_9FLAO|nr:hypothetical protein [Psychroserpens algicola]MCK8479012.1 hypothetical protein [Psychroserpens algicola]
MFKKTVFLILLSGFYNCEEIIEVEDISEETISILAPTNNAILDVNDINFSWEPIEHAENYHLQIATPNFELAQQIIEDTLLTSSNFTKILPTNEYQWRIKGVNSAYQTQFITHYLTIEE